MTKKKNSTPESMAPYAKLSHSFMFGEVMRHVNVCKPFLEAVLGAEIERIEYAEKEVTISDLYSQHGIRLDVFLADAEGTHYNIEMQNAPDSLEERIRYYQSSIDRHLLEKGKGYDALSQTYIIFVCDYDHFGLGCARYDLDKRVLCSLGSKPFLDKASAVVFNTKYDQTNPTACNVNPEMKQFLDYIRTNDPAVIKDSKLAQEAASQTEEVRNNEERMGVFMTAYEQMLREKKKSHAEGHAEGRAAGRAEGEAWMVYATYKAGRSIEEIMAFFNMPKSQILEYLELGERLST